MSPPSTFTTAGGISQLFAVNVIADPAWEEAKSRLWAMTRAERVAAMHAGRLSLRAVPSLGQPRPARSALLDGEWWFVAIDTPEAADAENITARAPSKDAGA